MTRARSTRRAGAALGAGVAVVVALALTLGSCSMPSFSGIDQLPLPGGADLGSHPYDITADFADVLSLVPQAAVKVNDVAVGRVTRVSLASDGWSAKVSMRIRGDVKLPANSYARLEQSSLLGEKFVQLSAPAKETKESAGGSLGPGAAIPISRTNRNPEVEEVLGALSMLLNGGGVNQLKTITTELNKAIKGREPEVRSMLQRVNTLVTDLDGHRGDITAALDGVNRLSATLATRKEQVATVLTGLAPGLKVLEDQRGSLLTMLTSLDTLSTVAVSTINKSKDDMVADLKAIAPILTTLADSGKDLPDSLQVLLTYPFTDEVLRGVKGDYLNVYLTVTAAPGTTLIPPLATPPPSRTPGASKAPGAAKGPGASKVPLGLPSVAGSGGAS
ncbi:Lipoprotein LprN [Streptomyces hundungensis]|uniref:Lipoprotein LprN n=1 Tax=Streptomyces hundungensis TaxID=1077946 RepID=A0A387HF93_9ACTN|nr:MCE family protein [Streptomyces hundungensis]AYG79347.1 Lipoprotein LprN [Streptomyces hundungensis]